MWEKKRVDGKKKLKLHAVPTIFGDAVTQIRNNRASEHRSDVESTQHSSVLTYTESSSKDVILSQFETGHHENAKPIQESLLLTHAAPSSEKEISKNAQEDKKLDAQYQGTLCTNI